MMKKLLPVILILLIILIAGGAYFLTSNQQKPRPALETKEIKKPQVTLSMTKNSLLDLLAQGKNQNCTFETTTNNVESSGTVYVSGKKIRVDFTTTIADKKNAGSMIKDENYTYIWGMGMVQGIKMKNTSVESTTNNNQNKQYFDETAKISYKCQPWNLNNSIFTPPTDIKFSEFSVPSPQVTGSTGSSTVGNQTVCAACNSLTGQAKTACLSQLNCQ